MDLAPMAQCLVGVEATVITQEDWVQHAWLAVRVRVRVMARDRVRVWAMARLPLVAPSGKRFHPARASTRP